ncbi:hypothetical protein F4803DRAFT_496940 [Xylaria telfairii]|nr:hypothetical protein F4803DRAFT_496940 [Xylaria telfairii]
MSAGVELDHYRDQGSMLGGNVFSRGITPREGLNPEQLRGEAWELVELRKSCMQRAHEAYERGDGAAAKQLSNEGKQHAAEADALFDKASKIIFKENNRNATADAIDLHGLYVAEAVKQVETRVREDRGAGKTHLHVIVGQGHHSVDHIQRIKPAIEQLCENLGLQYATEENAGRIYVNLQGGNITHIPPLPSQHDGYQHHPQHHNGNQQQYHGQQQQQQHHSGQNQQEEQYDEIETFLKKLVNKYCCSVM